MGFLDFISGGLANQPQYTPQNLDPGTLALIQQEAQRGSLSPDQIQAMELQGTSPTMENATGGAVANQQSTLGGGGGPEVSAALNGRAQRLYNAQYGELRNQAAAQAPLMQAGYMNNATNALQQQQNVSNANNTNAMQAVANQNAMRSKVIGQLFSGAGSFAGTMAAGRPSGPGVDSTTQNMMDQMNQNPGPQMPEMAPQFSSEPPGLGVNTDMGYGSPGTDGNGYYGNKNQAPGYGLGVTYLQGG